MSAQPRMTQGLAPAGARTAVALRLLLALQRLQKATAGTGIHAACRYLAVDLAVLGRQNGEPGPHLRRLEEEQADVTIGFQNAQANLAEVLDALLTQFHEELVRGNVVPLQAVELLKTVTNDHHRFAFQPARETLAMAHAVHGEPVQREQDY